MRRHLLVACGLLLVVALACQPAPDTQTPYAEVTHRLTRLIERDMATVYFLRIEDGHGITEAG